MIDEGLVGESKKRSLGLCLIDVPGRGGGESA